MSPLAPSDSVDAFLSWLAQPANLNPSGYAPAHNHIHSHGLGGIPPKAKVSDAEQEQKHHQQKQQGEHAAGLRELARSPLEDIAKPLLIDAPPKGNGHRNGHADGNAHRHHGGSHSDHGPRHASGKDAKDSKEKKRERGKSTDGEGRGGASGASAFRMADAAPKMAHMMSGSSVKVQ